MGNYIFKFLLMVQWTLLITQHSVHGKQCPFNEKLISGKKCYIYSPEYPNSYAVGTTCDWDLTTDAGTNIVLKCSPFSVPYSPNCKTDSLLISVTGNKNYTDAKKYCGKRSFSLVSNGSNLTIGLRSKSKQSKQGKFRCSVTTITEKESTSEANTSKEPPISRCDCGWKKASRIVGGVEAGVNEFAFMAALLYHGAIWCGANIISDRFVLSAAHCVLRHNPFDHLLLVGDHDLATGADTSDSAVYRIDAYELHPDYDEATKRNDIAIIRTQTQIIFNLSVGPICLPFDYTRKNFAGQNVILLGWGQLEFTGAQANTLQKARVTVITNQQCSVKLSNTISNGELCTYSEEGKDSCQFDSGGPVVWIDARTHRYQLLGIISNGVGCGSYSSPSINTRVTEHLKWIVDRTATNYCIK